MRRLIVAAGVVVVIAVAGTAQTLGGRAQRADSRSLSVVSARGAPLKLPAEDKRTLRLRAAGLGTIETLAVQNGRGFYRVRLQSAKDCYGAGSIAAEWPIGVIKCSGGEAAFPSEEQPIIDMSMIGLDRGEQGGPHFMRAQGVAADGVARIELRDATGATVAEVPVTNNTYWLSDVPAGAVRLVALDGSDRVLATVP